MLFGHFSPYLSHFRICLGVEHTLLLLHLLVVDYYVDSARDGLHLDEVVEPQGLAIDLELLRHEDFLLLFFFSLNLFFTFLSCVILLLRLSRAIVQV